MKGESRSGGDGKMSRQPPGSRQSDFHSSPFTLHSSILILLMFAALPLFAATPLPTYATFPSPFVSDPGSERIEAFGRDDVAQPNDALPKTVEGRHWSLQLRAEPPLELDADPTWDRLKRYFLSRGWQLVNEAGSKVLHLRANGVDAWMKLDIFNSEDVRVSLIEVGSQELKLTLPPPAAQPESVPAGGDFPYLSRVPGSRLKNTEVDASPMNVSTDRDEEPQLAGTSSTVKFYTVPEHLAVHQFLVAYRDALTAAGWAIVNMAEPSDGVLLAHYSRNGRDVWALLNINGDDIAMRVAAAGTASELAMQLDRACHVPLYGIHFDVNKATLRADSDAALRQVLVLMQGSPALSVEVQGHTDSAGDAATNQRLSAGRAESVRVWLVQHD